MSVLVSILGLGFLILVHEAGHFFVARAVGMNPRKFYLGFPPALVKTKRNGIEYGVGAIPLGGYVKIPGMHRPAAGDLDVHFGRAVEEDASLRRPVEELRQRLDESDYAGARQALGPVRESIDESRLSPVAYKSAERGINEIDDSLAPDAYWRARTWKRVAVIFAGPGANLLLAVVLFAALFMVVSGDYRFGFALRANDSAVTATVDDVLDGTPAESVGMRAGDRIVAINGQRVAADEIAATIRASGGRPLRVRVERNGASWIFVLRRRRSLSATASAGRPGRRFMSPGSLRRRSAPRSAASSPVTGGTRSRAPSASSRAPPRPSTRVRTRISGCLG